MTRADDPALTVPVIVRIAGLPATAVERFGSAACLLEAKAILGLERELAAVRGQIVDRLHRAIDGAPAAVRRALLDIKRDCYNGRDLAAWRSSAEWSIFAAAAPDLASRVAELEERLARHDQVFREIFAAEHEREVYHLLSVLGDDNLRQGLALASPEVLSVVDRLRRPVASFKRKERRLAQSLLRYVSRAALKLSPFSTLTRLGLGEVTREVEEPAVQLALGGATQRELRRIKKHIAVKYVTLLRQHPPFRAQLQVQLNPSVEPVGPGRYRIIEPFHWRLNVEAREFRYFNESQVSANLRGPLIDELLEVLRDEKPRYGELVSLLCAKLSSERSAVEGVLQKLTDLGFLLLLFPWPTNGFDPERALLAFLDRVPRDEMIDRFAAILGRLLELRDAAPPSDGRPQGYAEIDALRLRGYRVLTEGLGLPEAKEEVNDRQLHEDVFLVPREADRQAVARISRQAAEEAFASARPMVLYSDLNYTRYELLHSLAALAERHWPRQREVEFLELFHVAQPLWGDYVKAATAAIKEWRPDLWNPFDLPEVAALNQMRDRVLREMEACVRREGEELVLDRAGAERAVRHVPDTYVPAFGPCLFAQPATAAGDLWILNHMLDGTGRFSNRYTTVMPPAMAERLSLHLGGATVLLLGQPAEVVEILCARDDHLNVHRVQTARVLEMPGENADLPPERRLSVRDLRVRLDEALPVLVDRRGQRLVPIFLGTNGLVGMPTLVRFLSRFGIGEFRLMHPPRSPERQDGVKMFRQLRIGNLVLRRRMWSFSPATAFAGLAGASDANFYLATNRWRLEHGIPDRVFASERLQVKFDLWPIHKPQYVDFTSPSFVPVLRAALESARDDLKLEEVLPAPEAFPADESGRRWAFEAQLESSAFHRARPWRSPRPMPRVPRGRHPAWRAEPRQPSRMAQGGSDV